VQKALFGGELLSRRGGDQTRIAGHKREIKSGSKMGGKWKFYQGPNGDIKKHNGYGKGVDGPEEDYRERGHPSVLKNTRWLGREIERSKTKNMGERKLFEVGKRHGTGGGETIPPR